MRSVKSTNTVIDRLFPLQLVLQVGNVAYSTPLFCFMCSLRNAQRDHLFGKFLEIRLVHLQVFIVQTEKCFLPDNENLLLINIIIE